MNRDEYNILIDIVKQWTIDGKDIDPKQFIDKSIKDKRIKYGSGGNVSGIYLSKNKLSGPIPSSMLFT